MAPPHLVDEILEEIFLRLPTPAALARVSTACPSFRRIITARSFLRRFRKLHPPPLLGFLGFAAHNGHFHPAEEPHPSAALARALANAADFSYSFVPKPNNGLVSPWSPRDVRDGRVLLACRSLSEVVEIEAVFTNLAVCDPLSRRYVLLAPIPKEMTVQQEHLVEFEPMLAPIGEEEDETSFKVICTARYKSKLILFVFSSVTGQWCVAASPSWSSLGTAEPTWKHLDLFNCIRGCFYWAYLWRDKLLVLDACTMEFSTVDFRNQPGHKMYISNIVDGTKGALEMLTLAGDYYPISFYLYHTTQKINGGPSNNWQLKNVMELPSRCLYSTLGATEGFLFFQSFLDQPGVSHVDFFSLEVKTFEIKKVCMSTYHPRCVNWYFGLPPSLSKPSL
ncbi:unnamed protein product [Alopecurus aequalis]